MAETKCLIAGLPSSGKSTYIGALWYNLRNMGNVIEMKLIDQPNNVPDNVTHLNGLKDNWVKLTKIDRTNSNASDNVQLNLLDKESNERIQLNVPDFLGETFQGIIDLKNDEKLQVWCKEADSLLYMMNEISPGQFVDDTHQDSDEGNEDIQPMPELLSKDMSDAAQNIMILKFLLSQKKFKKVVVALTWWDEVTQNGEHPIDPDAYLKRASPALYNFIKYYFEPVTVVGISGQGMSYPETNDKTSIVYKEFQQEMVKKTKEGKRAFIGIGDQISYDLSLPIHLLI